MDPAKKAVQISGEAYRFFSEKLYAFMRNKYGMGSGKTENRNFSIFHQRIWQPDLKK
jgi:hypothetical protein